MLMHLNFILFKCLEGLLAILLKPISYVFPRDPKRIAFGAWSGRNYSDNAKYFALYLLEHTDYKLTWVGEPHIEKLLPKHPHLTFAKFGSFKATWHVLLAKFWIFTHLPFGDLTELPILGRGISIALGHGIPIKRLGQACADHNTSKESFPRRAWGALMRLSNPHFIISNNDMSGAMTSGYPNLYIPDNALPYGSPRIDYLINNQSNAELISSLKVRYAQLLGFDATKRIVLYLPTFRHSSPNRSLSTLSPQDLSNLSSALDRHNVILIEKLHPSVIAGQGKTTNTNQIVTITAEQSKSVDVQHLLLIADVLIGDYSSVYLDFAVLKRPIIHYAYDLESYTSADSGLLYNLNDIAGGNIVSDLNGLISELDSVLRTGAFNPKPQMQSLLRYENGNACDRLLNFIRAQTNH